MYPYDDANYKRTRREFSKCKSFEDVLDTVMGYTLYANDGYYRAIWLGVEDAVKSFKANHNRGHVTPATRKAMVDGYTHLTKWRNKYRARGKWRRMVRERIRRYNVVVWMTTRPGVHTINPPNLFKAIL